MIDTYIPLADDFLAAAHELQEITREQKALAAREKTCKEIIAKHLVEGQTGVDPLTGEALVAITHGAKVWNEGEAMKNLPADILATLTVTVTETRVDKDRAQDILPPALYALCCKTNKPSVKAL
jgi:hypothetical protein